MITSQPSYTRKTGVVYTGIGRYGGFRMKYNDKRFNRLHVGQLVEYRIRDNDWLDDYFAR